MTESFNSKEMMAVAGARELRNHDVVVVGLGLPQVSSVLAKYTHAPDLHMVLEIGVIDPKPVHTAVGIADPRIWLNATYFTSFMGTLGALLHRGLVDVGFLGALEVDQYGNINTSWAPEAGGRRHFTGSGGANDIASLARRTVIVMRHEKRKLVQRVRFITSPGYISGGASRRDAGLVSGGPSKVITDKCVFEFDRQSGEAVLASVHPGVTLEEVAAQTSFPFRVPESIKETEKPSVEELRLIRESIDPLRVYTGD
ncbi:MAG: CoA-transferase subunit beta [Firmicutes bacterium]|nr:CoA-transferase subunit beta [Bacillota bacterium]